MSFKEYFGFKNGYIIVFCGDTYKNKEYLKSLGAKYSELWGWYIEPDSDEEPEIPEIDGVTTKRIEWTDVAIGEGLRSKDEIKSLIEGSVDEEGWFDGDIGDFIDDDFNVDKVISFTGKYGMCYCHTMYRLSDNNVFVWYTTTKKLKSGTNYHVRGTLKDHREYKHQLQNILTGCIVEEII